MALLINGETKGLVCDATSYCAALLCGGTFEVGPSPRKCAVRAPLRLHGAQVDQLCAVHSLGKKLV